MDKKYLDFLEELAKQVTKGKYVLDTSRKDEDNHAGWFTDTSLEVENPYDPVNEKSWEKENTPKKYRRQYREREFLINPEGFAYRGPAQTARNAEYFQALSPDVMLQLIKLARKGLDENVKDEDIIIKSESGDTLRLPREKANEYQEAVNNGDEEKMEEIEAKYYIEDL